MKLLIDTCSFLWLGTASESLSPAAREAFLDKANERYLSAASVWEIAIKHSLGKLPLPEHPDKYIPKLRERSGIDALPIDEESALYAGRLPRLHTDPFDRILVAQAVVHGMTLLTPDPLIAQYAVRSLW